MAKFRKTDTVEDDEGELVTSDNCDDSSSEDEDCGDDNTEGEVTYPLTEEKIASIVDYVEKAFKDEIGKGNFNSAIDYACENLQDTIDRLQRLKIKNTPWRELFNTDTFIL